MRHLSLMMLCAGLLTLALTHAAVAQQTCDQPDEEGCVGIDILNLKFDPTHPVMTGLDQPYTSDDEHRRRILEVGLSLWKAVKAGAAFEAAPQTYTVCMWNVGTLSVSYMSEWRLPSGARNDIGVQRHVVTEVDPRTEECEVVFDPSWDLGQAQRAFEVTVVGPGSGLQIPWETIGARTYILICAENSNGIYPNRQNGAEEGHWLTPEYLNSSVVHGAVSILVPFLSRE